jgi:uncharacterized protein (TIGR03382 family)
MLLLVSAALAATSPTDLLAAVEAHLEHGEGCLTPLVNELRERADELSPEERARAARLLTPWKADLLAPVKPLRETPPPPAGTPTEPCFSIGENRITSEHFAVEWDGNTISEATAESFLESLEDGYRVEVQELGWKAPLQGDDYLMLAYVQSGNYQGAYTTVEYCGSGYVPYVVAYAGSFSSRSWAETMAVHEFNHAIQFGYGFAWEFWWWEATATYIESQVYPTNDWWAYYVAGYTDNPYLAFNASDQDDDDIFWHMYGMAIWATYVHEYLGGHDTILATWEAADSERGTYTFGMQEAFEEIGLDFESAYVDFIAKNVVMDYEAQNKLPNVDERSRIDELPASEEVDGNTRPQGYGQTYTRIEAGAGEGDLLVTFAGEDNVNWSVQLVEFDRTNVLRVVAADVVDGAGTVTLPDFGAEDVMLVVSPLTADDTKYDYSFSAEIVETPEVDTGDALVDGGGDVDGGGETPGGCGCDTGGTTGAVGVGVLLGLAAVARRRR